MNPFKEVPIQLLEGDQIPESLQHIPEPPKKLYVQGVLPKEKNYLTIVGSRKYSSYGKTACESILEGLQDYPFSIVSGLALGIDAIAHRKALEVGLTTLAVPGSGLDPSVIAPRTNYILARNILEKGGALLSEYEPQTPAAPYTFPRRNRIMAGLSDAVIIVEATKKSGTLITARLALDYNKTVFAIPGPITSPGSAGPNWLIKEGATPVTCSEDILEAFNIEKEIPQKETANLSKDELKLITLIRKHPDKTIILKESGWSISHLNITTTALELKGLIKDNGEKISSY